MTPHTDEDADAEERRTRELSRRALIGATATGAAAALTPASAVALSSDAVDETLTLAAVEAATDPRRRADGLEELHESRNTPTWVVEYREGDLESLEEWADGDEDREILDDYTHEGDRTAVVRADAGDVGAAFFSRLFDTGLASRNYVESIDANPILSLAEPVELEPEADGWPETSRAGAVLRYGGDPPVADGVAFDDVDPAPMSDVREAVGAEALDGEEPTVAVVDTGVNTAGERLFGYDAEDEEDELEEGADGTRVLEASKSMITGETVAEAGLEAIEDRNGHGTFVASQVAGDPPDADHTGILPEARVLGIKALDDDGAGSTADIARAIRYAADEGADAIVLSLGSPAWSHELDRALEYAAGAGAVSVAAVGNDRYATRWVAAPASSERSIAVASTTAGSGDEPVRSSYYSNVGPAPGSTDLSGGESTGAEPDVAAPGHEIETTVATTGGSLETEVLSGTSMAAPIVAAVAAAVGDSDPDSLRETLQEAAEPIEEAAEAEVGAGLVDAERALSGAASDEEQSDVMSDDAQVRDDAYRTESDSRGRAFLEWF